MEPQLHSHCVVINATQLPDGRWRSFSNEEVIANQKLLGQIYQNELACGLRKLGYQIEPKPYGQFEIKGYSEELLQSFSTRRQQVLDLIKTWETERVQIVDANGIPIASGKARRDAANLRSRKRKPKEMPREKLRLGWDALVKLKGLELLPLPAREPRVNLTPTQEVSTVVNDGVQHCSEREAVFKRTKIERFIFEHHLGAQSFQELSNGIDNQPQLIRVTDGKYTTETALHLELDTIRLMQEGKGQVTSILFPGQVSGYLENKTLTAGQQEAIALTFTTQDRFIAWQGVTGAGKSFALEQVKAIAQSSGYIVKGYAPSAETASVLTQATGIQTATIASLLSSPSDSRADSPSHSPSSSKASTVWIVDEAGLLRMKDAHDLMSRAESENASQLFGGRHQTIDWR